MLGGFCLLAKQSINKPREPVVRKTILTLLLAAMSSGAMAGWVQVGEGASGKKTYIDPQTIKKDGNLRRVWVIVNFPTADKDGIHSRRVLDEYDCKGERWRALSLSLHSEPMADGRVINSYNATSEWDYIPPGTIAETIFKFVCNSQRGRSE